MENRVIGGKRVFVIHGSEKQARDDLHQVLSELGFEVVILGKETVRGARTIIEKFEMVAPTCNYAIALMTPDDKSFEELSGEQRSRARQNVLIELGWFMAHLGRDKTFIVVVGDIEMPSDIIGIEVCRCGDSVNSDPDKLKDFLRGIAGE